MLFGIWHIAVIRGVGPQEELCNPTFLRPRIFAGHFAPRFEHRSLACFGRRKGDHIAVRRLRADRTVLDIHSVVQSFLTYLMLVASIPEDSGDYQHDGEGR